MEVIDIAESIDSYREACNENEANRLARKGHVYELSEITPAAAAALQAAAAEIPLLDTCELVILDSSADSGFPHTRPNNFICLPANMCTERVSQEFKVTLLHEAIHIHQRNHVSEWNNGCSRAGWKPIPSDRIPSKFVERVRINPDTMSTPFWAWDTHHVPLPLFKATPRLNDAPIQWLDLRNDTLFHTPPPSFVKMYGSSVHQPEHPYEIYAENFSKMQYNTSDIILEKLRTI